MEQLEWFRMCGRLKKYENSTILKQPQGGGKLHVWVVKRGPLPIVPIQGRLPRGRCISTMFALFVFIYVGKWMSAGIDKILLRSVC